MTHDQVVFETMVPADHSDFARPFGELRFGSGIRAHVKGAEHAQNSGFADERMRSQFGPFLCQIGRSDIARVVDQTFFIHDAQIFQCDSGRNRVA